MKLTLRMDNLNIQRWFIDYYPSRTQGLQGTHTVGGGGSLSLGKGAVLSCSTGEEINTTKLY